MSAFFKLYRKLVSPLLHFFGGPSAGCRFEPTCSAYIEVCFQRFAFWKALFLSLKRIGRCQPWGGSGFDPAPSSCSRDARWKLPKKKGNH